MNLKTTSLCLGLVGSLLLSSAAADQHEFKLQILHSSDNESSFQNPNTLEPEILHYATLVEGLKKLAAAEGVNTIHLTAGDHIIPNPYFQTAAEVPGLGHAGLADIAFYNAMGLTANEKLGIQADVALKNGGGIRDTIVGPAIIKLTIDVALAFDNQMAVLELTGAQLIATLVSNFSAQGDLSRTFVLATNSFQATGGDGYASLAAATPLLTTDIGEQRILAEYIQEGLGGAVDLADPPASPRVTRLDQ